MIASPNHSSRGSAKVIWVVLHTAEGARTVDSLGAYFAKSATQASSHVGIDDQRIEQYVDYSRAAWTLRNGNSRSDNAELCGFAAWSRDEWLKNHPRMIEQAAQWVRERCLARNVPIVKLSAADVAAGRPGVLGHYDYTIGARDGSHTDPGPGFPWDVVIAKAQQGTQTPSAPAQGVPAPVKRSAASVLAEFGMERPQEVVELAEAAGVELAAAAAMFTMETGDKKTVTGGGRNIWGHDKVVVAPNTYTPGGPVTRENYAAYKAAIKAGKAGRNGAGPGQITFWSLQDECDALGGTWDWRTNTLYSFRHLAGLIKAKGLQGGFTAYNGGSQYGIDAMRVYQTWKQRLANTTTTPEDDDMWTPEQQAQINKIERALSILVQQVCGEASTIDNPFPGADKGGGWECHDGVRRTLVDIGRRGLEELDS